MVVASLALLFPFFAAGSPPPETVAVLVMLAGASAATFTVSVIGGALAPAAIMFAPPPRLQVRGVWLVGGVQFQFVPVAAEYVNPVGRASVTVTLLVVARFPACVLVMVRSGVPTKKLVVRPLPTLLKQLVPSSLYVWMSSVYSPAELGVVRARLNAGDVPAVVRFRASTSVNVAVAVSLVARLVAVRAKVTPASLS